MISRFEERYYNDINSLASTMPRVVELLEKLVENAKPVEPEPEKTDCQSPQHNSIWEFDNYTSGCCAQCDQDILDEEESKVMQAEAEEYKLTNSEKAHGRRNWDTLMKQNQYTKLRKEWNIKGFYPFTEGWQTKRFDELQIEDQFHLYHGFMKKPIDARLPFHKEIADANSNLWISDGKKDFDRDNIGVLMHSRPVNWDADYDDELDLTVVFKNDDGKLIVNPICPRCNYRYTACSKNGKDWNCENCDYDWQTHNNIHEVEIHGLSAHDAEQTSQPWEELWDDQMNRLDTTI